MTQGHANPSSMGRAAKSVSLLSIWPGNTYINDSGSLTHIVIPRGSLVIGTHAHKQHPNENQAHVKF